MEISAGKPGALDRPLATVRPRIGVVTSIGGDHLKAFHSVEAIAEEKAKVIACLPEDGTAVLNADDPLVIAMAERFSGKIITFGLAEDAALRAENVRSAWPDRLSFTAVYQGSAVEVRSRLCGIHWTTAVLAALAVGLAAGIPLAQAAKAIESVEPYPSRMHPVSRGDGVTFIMDDWKSSHWTMASVFAFLEAARARRKIIVIGTLSDYGGTTAGVYSRVARTALGVADHVVFVGPMATHALRARQQENADRLHAFSTVKSAADFLHPLLLEGDVIVLKGSTNADHLGRLAHHWLEPISCWRMDCRKNMRCTRCPALRADLQRDASRQADRPAATDVTEVQDPASAMLPHCTGPIEVLVGIGNAGSRYRNTPHNVGFEVLDALAEQLGLDWTSLDSIAFAHTKLKVKTILLVKPQKQVNNTGKCLKWLSDQLGFRAEDCILIQDDVHLPLGKLRSRARGSDGGHKGVRSALVAFQTVEFRRLKIGVAPAGQPASAADYLVTPFTSEAAATINPAIEAAVDRLLSMLRDA
jgi:aminoacyl-tRNA hydrolase